MIYNPNDPSTWNWASAVGHTLAVDLGLHGDHTVMVLMAAWPEADYRIGVTYVRQFPLDTPHMEVVDAISAIALDDRITVIADSSNNTAFCSLLAPRVSRAPNRLIAAHITKSQSHAPGATPMPVVISGKRSAIRNQSLSHQQLFDDVIAEGDNGMILIGSGGSPEILQAEIMSLDRTKLAQGVHYSAPSGKHDDAVTALALGVYWCRRFGQLLNGRPRPRGGPAPSPKGWT
jgi:hypothetical protein